MTFINPNALVGSFKKILCIGMCLPLPLCKRARFKVTPFLKQVGLNLHLMGGVTLNFF
jgi:hypothetical protein